MIVDATAKGDIKALKEYYDRGEDLDTPVCLAHIAVLYGHLEALKFILDHGGHWNECILEACIERGHEHIVAYLHEIMILWGSYLSCLLLDVAIYG